MKEKFHISPDGIARKCSANIKECHYGLSEEQHYSTKNDAQKAYENEQSRANGGSFNSISRNKENNNNIIHTKIVNDQLITVEEKTVISPGGLFKKSRTNVIQKESNVNIESLKKFLLKNNYFESEKSSSQSHSFDPIIGLENLSIAINNYQKYNLNKMDAENIISDIFNKEFKFDKRIDSNNFLKKFNYNNNRNRNNLRKYIQNTNESSSSIENFKYCLKNIEKYEYKKNENRFNNKHEKDKNLQHKSLQKLSSYYKFCFLKIYSKDDNKFSYISSVQDTYDEQLHSYIKVYGKEYIDEREKIMENNIKQVEDRIKLINNNKSGKDLIEKFSKSEQINNPKLKDDVQEELFKRMEFVYEEEKNYRDRILEEKSFNQKIHLESEKVKNDFMNKVNDDILIQQLLE